MKKTNVLIIASNSWSWDFSKKQIFKKAINKDLYQKPNCYTSLTMWSISLITVSFVCCSLIEEDPAENSALRSLLENYVVGKFPRKIMSVMIYLEIETHVCVTKNSISSTKALGLWSTVWLKTCTLCFCIKISNVWKLRNVQNYCLDFHHQMSPWLQVCFLSSKS